MLLAEGKRKPPFLHSYLSALSERACERDSEGWPNNSRLPYTPSYDNNLHSTNLDQSLAVRSLISKMQQLLFAVIFSEMGLILVMLFKTPLRKLVIVGLDRVKRGRGPVMVKTVAGTVLVVLMSSVYSMAKIRRRRIDEGAVNPTDQVLMAKHLLEATLMGNDQLFIYFSFISAN